MQFTSQKNLLRPLQQHSTHSEIRLFDTKHDMMPTQFTTIQNFHLKPLDVVHQRRTTPDNEAWTPNPFKALNFNRKLNAKVAKIKTKA